MMEQWWSSLPLITKSLPPCSLPLLVLTLALKTGGGHTPSGCGCWVELGCFSYRGHAPCHAEILTLQLCIRAWRGWLSTSAFIADQWCKVYNWGVKTLVLPKKVTHGMGLQYLELATTIGSLVVRCFFFFFLQSLHMCGSKRLEKEPTNQTNCACEAAWLLWSSCGAITREALLRHQCCQWVEKLTAQFVHNIGGTVDVKGERVNSRGCCLSLVHLAATGMKQNLKSPSKVESCAHQRERRLQTAVAVVAVNCNKTNNNFELASSLWPVVPALLGNTTLNCALCSDSWQCLD